MHLETGASATVANQPLGGRRSRTTPRASGQFTIRMRIDRVRMDLGEEARLGAHTLDPAQNLRKVIERQTGIARDVRIRE